MNLVSMMMAHGMWLQFIVFGYALNSAYLGGRLIGICR